MTEQHKTLTDGELAEEIAARPYPKVTEESIKAKIAGADYTIHLPTLTVCVITMQNGIKITCESACVDPRNFDPEIGRNLAYRNAFGKLWPLEGYLLAEQRVAPPALPDIELVSAKVHEAWMVTKHGQGVESRKSEAGEELMRPYDELSESAKDLDRGTVRAVYAAIEEARKS
jgi:hypothetical protein